MFLSIWWRFLIFEFWLISWHSPIKPFAVDCSKGGLGTSTLDVFVFLTAAGFFETESESSSLLLITAAAFARFPFLAGSLVGGASAALALVGFFVASFACKVRNSGMDNNQTCEWKQQARVARSMVSANQR